MRFVLFLGLLTSQWLLAVSPENIRAINNKVGAIATQLGEDVTLRAVIPDGVLAAAGVEKGMVVLEVGGQVCTFRSLSSRHLGSPAKDEPRIHRSAPPQRYEQSHRSNRLCLAWAWKASSWLLHFLYENGNRPVMYRTAVRTCH